MAHTDHHDPSGAPHHGHYIIPFKVLATVFGALVALTVITVLTAQLDLGSFNVPLALAIALTKAFLVVAFFMALKYDNRVNTLVFAVGTIFVLVFIVFTLIDTAMRGDLGIMEAGTIADQQREEEALMARASGSGGDSEETPVAAATDTHTEEAAGTATAPDGEALFTTHLCNTCHMMAADAPPGVGPNLYDVGSRLSRDEIHQSIMEPDAVIAEGYSAGIMTATLNGTQFYDKVTPEDIDALVDYLASQTGE